MTKPKKPLVEKDRKKIVSFFLLGFPTLLIVILGMIQTEGWGIIGVSILLAFYQFANLKQFLDHYYDEVY